MLVDLNKEDLIILLLNFKPNEIKSIDNDLIKNFGDFNKNNEWVWNKEELEKLKETRIYFIYKKCRKSLEIKNKQ